MVPTAAVYCATKYAVWAISEGLRQQNSDLRMTVDLPGVVESELHIISYAATGQVIQNYRRIAIAPDSIAPAIAFAIAQPRDVDVSEDRPPDRQSELRGGRQPKWGTPSRGEPDDETPDKMNGTRKKEPQNTTYCLRSRW